MCSYFDVMLLALSDGVKHDEWISSMETASHIRMVSLVNTFSVHQLYRTHRSVV